MERRLFTSESVTEYVFECCEEAFRGLSFVDPKTGLDIRRLKQKIADVSAAVGDAL